MIRLSKHFLLSEFTASSTAASQGIDNSPNQDHLDNLVALCTNVLQPIRDAYRRPVRINSGYRSPALNKAIGGSQTSQHSKGQAADIEIDGISNRDLAQWIKDNLTFDQLIVEFVDDPNDPNSGWVHVSYRSDGNNRKEALEAFKDNQGKTRYKYL